MATLQFQSIDDIVDGNDRATSVNFSISIIVGYITIYLKYKEDVKRKTKCKPTSDKLQNTMLWYTNRCSQGIHVDVIWRIVRKSTQDRIEDNNKVVCVVGGGKG